MCAVTLEPTIIHRHRVLLPGKKFYDSSAFSKSEIRISDGDQDSVTSVLENL